VFCVGAKESQTRVSNKKQFLEWEGTPILTQCNNSSRVWQSPGWIDEDGRDPR